MTGTKAFLLALLAIVPLQAPAEEMDMAAFGQLPARFNGRVITYDALARNCLTRISGRDIAHDAESKTIDSNRPVDSNGQDP